MSADIRESAAMAARKAEDVGSFDAYGVVGREAAKHGFEAGYLAGHEAAKNEAAEDAAGESI